MGRYMSRYRIWLTGPHTFPMMYYMYDSRKFLVGAFAIICNPTHRSSNTNGEILVVFDRTAGPGMKTIQENTQKCLSCPTPASSLSSIVQIERPTICLIFPLYVSITTKTNITEVEHFAATAIIRPRHAASKITSKLIFTLQTNK